MDPRSMKSLQAGEGKRQRRSLSSKSAKEFEEDGQKEVTMSTFDMVINLLNHASMASKDSRKLENLQQVQELVINKEPALIDNFTDEIVAFQGDRSQDIRKFVVGFVEEVCKKDASLFSKLLPNYLLMLVDENVNVLKKVIQSSTQLFRLCIQWLACSKSNVAVHEATWKVLNQLLDNIFELLDSENDGVRTQTIKFTEKVILTLSERQRHSEMPKKVEVCSSVDELPHNHPFLKKNSLKLKGEKLLQQFLAFVVSPAISSVNLMAAMGTLTTIAKQRPQYMSIVVQTFEALHANLPPTLAKTQVASVRKHLKMQLLNLLKHIASIEFHPQITNLLYDLGTSSSEIARNMPKGAEAARKEKGKSKKRSPVDDEKAEIAKKPKLDVEDEESVGEKRGGKTSAIDLTADELATLLTPENVANLVLLSMVMLPDKIPDAFQASYTPIESAGTMEQIMHLARLLAVQMTAVGIGSGIQKAAQMQALEEERKLKEIKREEMEKEKKKPIQTVIGGMVEQEAKDEEKPEKKPVSIEPVQPVGPSKGFQRRLQGFRLSGITKPLSLDVKDRIIKMAVLRVLNSERSAITGGVHTKWQKILTTLVAQFGGDLHRALAKFILSDMRNRSQLAFQWLYEEFNIYLENSRGLNDRTAQENYNACLTGLLQGILDKHEAKEGIFTKLVLQAPLLTEGAVRLVKQYCEDERRSHSGLLLIREMITRRPSKRMMFLRALLDLSTSHVEKVRNEAIEVVKTFYDEREDLEELIEQYAVANLSYLTHPQPPDEMCKPTNPTKSWTEEVMKQCLTLFLSLLPVKHQLIHKLAATYVEATADIKRVVLRALETPVNGMGMTSPELLKLVESCPKGAETLVTRMLHILTDREHPSEELVSRVRDLYQKRVPDVRFLIPVLNGLEKEEVLLSLPKLIRLNPPVVKGVFNRLLGVQRHQDSQPSMSALSPVELLVALHNIEPTQADVKCVIKATSLCFAEKTVYTSEVLVTVINRLVEQQTMPTLLMRTVIQSLITYPRLSGFVMNILQRLIMKRVWETSKVWEGFIRCCQRMKPQSFQVLLQLPPAQLANVFDVVAEMREPLLQHVQKFTPQQRQHISPAILSVLEKSREQRLADEARHAHQLQLEQKRIEEMRQRVALQREATALAQFQCQQQLLEARKAAQEVAQRLQESQKGKVKDEPNTETDQSFPQQQATATSSATVTSQPPSQPAFPVAAPKPAEAVAAISVKQEVKEESRSGTPTQDERLPARK